MSIWLPRCEAAQLFLASASMITDIYVHRHYLQLDAYVQHEYESYMPTTSASCMVGAIYGLILERT